MLLFLLFTQLVEGFAQMGRNKQKHPKQEKKQHKDAFKKDQWKEKTRAEGNMVGDDEERAYADFVYKNVFFEWYYRVIMYDLVSTQR